MRKFIVLLLIFSITAFCGCNKNSVYASRISELKQDVYEGSVEDINITAVYGFRENPFVNDGKVGDIYYGYTFKLGIIPDGIRRFVEFTFDNKSYSADFELYDLTGEYKAFIEIQHHFEREFTVNLAYGTDVKTVVLTSALSEDCIDYKKALDVLSDKQNSLLETFMIDGEFNAEIYMRIFIKEQKPYWYVGIASGNDKLKALLIDGISGDLIAVRDIF